MRKRIISKEALEKYFGKSEGTIINEFAEKLKERIYHRLWASEFVHEEIDKLVEEYALAVNIDNAKSEIGEKQ
jgi:hypothetical protein